MSPRARRVRRALLVLTLGVVAAVALTRTGRYLVRAAWEEGKILARRRSIAALIAAPATDPITRAKLELVLAARAYAVDSLGLAAKQSFTTYSRLDHDTLVMVLSAAYRDRLAPYTWWFPIVGRVPYKGYFAFASAQAAARALEREGLDTYVRPAAAFSTLGFFNDPLVSATLDGDSASLANTVIHELTHNTYYASGQAVFNESFANFVGSEGAIRFFTARGDTANARRAAEQWALERAAGRFWQVTFDELDSAFRAHPESVAARLAARDTVYARAQQRFSRDLLPLLPGYRAGMTVRLPLNNALVLARRVYRTGLGEFDAVLAREHGDLRAAVRRIIALARSRPRDPYGAVRDWLASASGGAVAGDTLRAGGKAATQ